MSNVVSLSASEAANRLAGGGGRVLDVREPSEYAAGRLAQSENIPLGILPEVAKAWRKEEPLFLYCQSGRRSEKGVERLQALGFTSASHLEGGFAAWQQAGLPSERNQRAPWALERQVRFTVGLLVIVFTALGLTVTGWVLYLNFAIAGGLIFSAVTNTCGLALVLTRLPWNRPPRDHVQRS